MRPLICLAIVAAGCGDVSNAPSTSIWLGSDDTYPCAGAAEVQITIDRTDGQSLETRLAAAVSPEQLECNFDAGVAEAYFGVLVGDIEVGVPYVAQVRMLDSTGLVVGAGSSEPFRAGAGEDGDSVSIELTRTAPLGTALVDLDLINALAQREGTLDIAVLAGSTPVGQRQLVWPGDALTKRPLRISGLAGTGLRLSMELADDSNAVSLVSESFSLGSSTTDAFARPEIVELD